MRMPQLALKKTPIFKQEKYPFCKRRRIFRFSINSISIHISHRKLQRKQECIPVGCVPSAAMTVCRGGCLPRGVSAGRCLFGGVFQGVSARHPVNRITDRCENITFPQLRLRVVNISFTFALARCKRTLTHVYLAAMRAMLFISLSQ